MYHMRCMFATSRIFGSDACSDVSGSDAARCGVVFTPFAPACGWTGPMASPLSPSTSPSVRRRALRDPRRSLNHIYKIYQVLSSPIYGIRSAACTAQTSVYTSVTQRASNPCTNQVLPRDATQYRIPDVCDNDQRTNANGKPSRLILASGSVACRRRLVGGSGSKP
jgi:hypothetical protein